ncbi:MAG: hypothetical protein QNJ22_15830 [Desulfosarcinaceae bacterium]|nr:hypothetical protein [Desulfosarcinaceae bacterium]
MQIGPLIVAVRPRDGNQHTRWIGVWRDYTADVERIWTLITDTQQWPLWGPSLKAVRCQRRVIHAGVRGRVQTVVGIWLPFTVTAYCHLCSWDWRVGGITATGHEVATTPDGRRRLIFWVPLWAWPYAVVCWWALRRIQRVLA